MICTIYDVRQTMRYLDKQKEANNQYGTSSCDNILLLVIQIIQAIGRTQTDIYIYISYWYGPISLMNACQFFQTLVVMQLISSHFISSHLISSQLSSPIHSFRSSFFSFCIAFHFIHYPSETI